MKKNAILLGSIMFVAAGCAHQGGYERAGYDAGYDADMTAANFHASEEAPVRNPDGTLRHPASTALQSDPASFSHADMPGTEGEQEAIRARGVEPYSSAESSSLIVEGQGERDSFEQSSATTFESDRSDESIRGSANWNPSDDLLRDGLASSEDEMNNDASVGGAASSESGSASSEALDSDLNASNQLEENIAGEFELQGTESSEAPEPQVGVTGDEPEWLFQNNRARGVGSAATGEFGVAHSRDPLAGGDQQLAQRVKARLVEDSTGTHGLMRHQVARNIQVTARNGEITLKGSVPSEQDRKLIEIRAMEISGVERVNNQLDVNPQVDPANRDLSIGHDLEDATSELDPE